MGTRAHTKTTRVRCNASRHSRPNLPRSTDQLLHNTAQVALNMEDSQEMEPPEFEIMSKIVIVFENTDKEAKVKDEVVFGAIVAHLNRLEGVDLEPEFISKSASGVSIKKIFLKISATRAA